MPGSRNLILADDLTGGNSAGALFAEAGMRTLALSGPASGELLHQSLDTYDAVVVNAESRHLGPDEAAEISAAIVRAAGPLDLVACRIDTTLRGNIGPTVEAVLSTRRKFGPAARVVGLCVPAFPAAGRVTVNGNQLLRGRLLEHTELAADVRSPVTGSTVTEAVERQSALRTTSIGIAEVLAGPDRFRSVLVAALDSAADVIVIDALTTEHIAMIASVAAEVARAPAHDPDPTDPGPRAPRPAATGREPSRSTTRGDATAPFDTAALEWVAIDPGPSSLALTRARLGTASADIVLGISGSTTEVTRAQLIHVSDDDSTRVLRVILDEAGLPDVAANVTAAVEASADATTREIILATVLDTGDLRDLGDHEAQLLAARLAEITARLLDRASVSGLYSTGGDITAAVLTRLGAIGMEIDTEIVPLAVGGTIVGGEHPGLPIVTKGGLIGGPDTARLCLDHLQRWARVRRHHPAP